MNEGQRNHVDFLVLFLLSRQKSSWCILRRSYSNWCDLIEADIYNFCAHLFQLQKNIVPSVFENNVASKVFIYHCNMTWHTTIGEILYPHEGVKYFEAYPPSTLWEVVSNGSRWVHPNAAISNQRNYYPLHFRMTTQTVKGYIPIIMSPSGNGSCCLVRVDDGWVTCRIV